MNVLDHWDEVKTGITVSSGTISKNFMLPISMLISLRNRFCIFGVDFTGTISISYYFLKKVQNLGLQDMI